MRTARPTIGEHADGQCLSAGRFAQPFHRRLCFIRKVLPSRHDTLPLRHHLAVSKAEQPSDINQSAMLKEGLEVSATSKPPCGAKHRGFQLLAHPLGLPVHIRVGVSGRAARHEQRGRTRRGQLCVFAAGRRSHSTATATVWLCGALREGVNFVAADFLGLAPTGGAPSLRRSFKWPNLLQPIFKPKTCTYKVQEREYRGPRLGCSRAPTELSRRSW